METYLIEPYEYLAPDEVENKARDLFKRYASIPTDVRDNDTLRLIFDLMKALIFAKNFKDLSHVMADAVQRVEHRMEENENDEFILDKWITLKEFEAGSVVSTPQRFAERRYFEEIIRYCGEKGGKFELRRRQMEITLLDYFRAWINMGGKADEGLEALADKLEAQSLDYLERTREQPEHHLDFRRTYASYLARVGRIREAVVQYHEALELLSPNPAFSPTTVAGFRFELAVILTYEENYADAVAHFRYALDVYHSAGEAYDVYAAQVEALLDECLENLT